MHTDDIHKQFSPDGKNHETLEDVGGMVGAIILIAIAMIIATLYPP